MKTRISNLLFAALFSALALASVWLLTAFAQAAPGDLDLTFAGTGKSRAGFGGRNDYGLGMAIQSDGKTIVVGTATGPGSSFGADFAVARFNVDGSLDSTFDVDGKVTTRIGQRDLVAWAVRIQADGKLVVVGSSEPFSGEEIIVVRYNTDGSLDDSFDGDGIVVTPLADLNSAQAVLIQPADGKIVVSTDGAVLRYLPTGALDSSFGSGGIAFFFNVTGRGSALQADGKLLLTGRKSGGASGTDSLAVVRMNPNGTLDTTFDGDGMTAGFPTGPLAHSRATAIAIQAGNNTTLNPNKIVVVGDAIRGTNSDSVIARYNLDGSLDNTFDGDGTLLLPLANDNSLRAVGFQTTLQGANRIVVAGNVSSNGSDYLVARLLLNGDFDNTFDGDGIVTVPVGVFAELTGMVIRSGKITVAGDVNPGATGIDFAVVRLNLADGSLDTSFDGDGIKIQDVGDLPATARGVVAQKDGKILVVGGITIFFNGVLTESFALVRYNVDGSFDQSFGAGGRVVTALNGSGRAAVVQPDRKILVAGFMGTGAGSSDFAMVRYLPDGSLDPTFNGDGDNDGHIRTSMSTGDDVAYAIALQPDGKILLAGSAFNGSNFDFAVARYHANGSLDTSFDGDGKTITPVGAGNDEGRAMIIQPDGRIVVAGYHSNGANTDFAVIRYNPDGSPDRSFSFDGVVTTPILAGNDEATALALDGEKIVVAGFAHNGVNNDFALARYHADGSLDNSFDRDGKLTTEIGAEDAGRAVAILTDGKILVTGFSFTGGTSDFALVRYNRDGSLDNTHGTGGRTLVSFGPASADQSYALALDAIGRAVVAGESNGAFGTARLLGDPFLKIFIFPGPEKIVVLEGLGVPGLINVLEMSPDLSPNSFQVFDNVIPNSRGNWEYNDAGASGNKRFYRLRFP